MPENVGLAPCGQYVDDMRHEQWRQEMSCYIIGCDRCGLHRKGEPIYYVSSELNTKRGIAIWARHMLGEPGYD